MTPISRRSFLRQTAAAGATLAALPNAVSAAQNFDLGDGRLVTLSDGSFTFPNAFFVGASEEQKAELGEMVTFGANAYLIRRGDRTYLIDAGAGNAAFITSQFQGVGKVPDELADAEVGADEITDVVITHMHPDHFGGVVRDGAPMFPNAKIHLDGAEWDFWMRKGFAEDAPEQMRAMVAAVQETGAAVGDQIVRHGGDVDLGAGVTALAARGHTPGHTSFLLDLGDERVLVLGDTAVTDHIHFADPSVGWVLDLDPEQAEATRRRLFEMAAAEGLLVAGNHLTAPGLGRIERAGDAYRFVPH